MTDRSAPDLHTLPTPALILDHGRVSANARRMTEHAAALGLALRPHMKTAKSVDVAALAQQSDGGGLTVSTLREAEAFVDAGRHDLLLAVCISPDRFERAADVAARLPADGPRLGLITDEARVAAELGAHAARRGVAFDVLVELDVGEHRTGVDPAGPALLEVARAVHEAQALTLAGVLCHAGHAYQARSPDRIARIAEDERAQAAAAAERLRAAGLPCPRVSIGSTPSVTHLRSGEGVTELRPGVYVLQDLFQAAIGSCDVTDVAATVLATVIGRHPDGRALILDAGALALSKDRSTAATDQDAGYGLVADIHGDLLAGLRVVDVHQEHGEVRGHGPLDLARFEVGTRLRVLPNHACITAAAHDRFHVVTGRDTAVKAVWPRITGW